MQMKARVFQVCLGLLYRMFCKPFRRALLLIATSILILSITPYFFFELQKYYKIDAASQNIIAYEMKTEGFLDEDLSTLKKTDKPFFQDLMRDHRIGRQSLESEEHKDDDGQVENTVTKSNRENNQSDENAVNIENKKNKETIENKERKETKGSKQNKKYNGNTTKKDNKQKLGSKVNRKQRVNRLNSFTTTERSKNETDKKKRLREKVKQTKRKVVNALLEMEDPESKIVDLIPDVGGVPRRCLLLGAFRTGSSFLGQLLSSNNAIFHIYEPLHSAKIYKQGFGNELAKEKTELISNYMKCNFSQAETIYTTAKHLEWMSKSKAFQGENNVTFMNDVCRQFPYQVFKTTRYRGTIAHMLLEDETVNPNIIMLVRDPRGAYLSRKKSQFCTPETCLNITNMCEEMHEDFLAAQNLIQQYPNRFMTIRFEEFSLDTLKYAPKLMNFCEIPYTYTTRKFLNSHTNKTGEGIYSTYRRTSDVPFKWKTRLTWRKIQAIQKECRTPMQEWGYTIFNSKREVIDSPPEKTIT